jgi:putative Holliday junction resolvase
MLRWKIRMRILAIDPGEKRIGLALSDPERIIASSFGVVIHKAFEEDILSIKKIIIQNEVSLVVIGQAFDEDGNATPSSRRAVKLGEGLKARFQIEIVYYDEGGTTQEAKEAAFLMGLNRKNRRGHLDNLAATILLQRYLDMIMVQRENLL